MKRREFAVAGAAVLGAAAWPGLALAQKKPEEVP